MNDQKPRKPMFGHKGTLPGSAGRYSLSSRPPRSSERVETAEIPGPGRIPREALEAERPPGASSDAQSPLDVSPIAEPALDPAAGAWKGSTLGGWGTEVRQGTNIADLKATLARGSPDYGVRDDAGPGTIRGTPPPPNPSLSPTGENTKGGIGPMPARRISISDTDRPKAPSATKAESPSHAPASPRTERGVPSPADVAGKKAVRLIEVESVRMGQSVNTTLPQGVMPICEEIGAGAAGTPEVSILSAPKGSQTSLYVSAIAVARRLAQVMPGQIVLVETDFETPALASTLGISLHRGRGFSEQLHARAWGGESGRWHLVNPGLGFDVLCESKLRTPGLLWSDEFANAIAMLRANYSVILLIAPARLTAVDHRALGDVANAVYVVSNKGDDSAQTYLTRGPLSQKIRLSVVVDSAQADR